MRREEVGLKGRQADVIRGMISAGLEEMASGGGLDDDGAGVEGPRFPHDCTCCQSLGIYQDADLWFCGGSETAQHQTVIARFGPEGDYRSGLAAASHDVYLAEAKRRAVERGLLPVGKN